MSEVHTAREVEAWGRGYTPLPKQTCTTHNSGLGTSPEVGRNGVGDGSGLEAKRKVQVA